MWSNWNINNTGQVHFDVVNISRRPGTTLGCEIACRLARTGEKDVHTTNVAVSGWDTEAIVPDILGCTSVV